MTLISFQEALKQTNSPRILLLGNGFSRAFTEDRPENYFNYEYLAKKTGDTEIEELFVKLDTYDFEQVIHEMQSLRRNLLILNHFFPTDQRSETVKKLEEKENNLKQALINAIHSIHPPKSSVLSDYRYEKCAYFLKNFDFIYTVNYDLLLYWTQLRYVNNHPKIIWSERLKNKFRDGFWKKSFNKEIGYWDICCQDVNLFYLHGALHLFSDNDSGKNTCKLIYKQDDDLFSQIEKKIMVENNYPLYVAEGNWHDKFKKILANDYLRYAYFSLKSRQGSIFTFGISFNKDDHLLDAIANSQVNKIFIGVRNDNNEGAKNILNKVQDKLSTADSNKEINCYSTVPSIW